MYCKVDMYMVINLTREQRKHANVWVSVHVQYMSVCLTIFSLYFHVCVFLRDTLHQYTVVCSIAQYNSQIQHIVLLNILSIRRMVNEGLPSAPCCVALSRSIDPQLWSTVLHMGQAENRDREVYHSFSSRSKVVHYSNETSFQRPPPEPSPTPLS